MKRRSLEWLTIPAALFLVVASVQITARATTCGAEIAEPAAKTESAETEGIQGSIEEKWGIKIESIRMTAHGYMVDFRYRVLNAEKAKDLFVRKTKPYLIDQASGKVLRVPRTAKVGPLRTSDKPQEGKIYWMFFGNRGGFVRAGSMVTVVIGAFKVENLVVE